MIELHWSILLLVPVLAIYGAGHALLNKRDPRAALGWIAVCLTFPVAGPLLYFVFGVNRVRTEAKRLARVAPPRHESGYGRDTQTLAVLSDSVLATEYAELSRVADTVTRRECAAGNRVEMLRNGEEAYAAMLRAIEEAREHVYLCTYIFATDATGRRFIAALGAAQRRGLDVRVILDGVGEYYSLPRAGRLLVRRGVRLARFLPPKLLPPTVKINLRNHRKILVVDHEVGFAGGMNISDRHLAADESRPGRIIDLHFRFSGPVVAQLEDTFREDWHFCTHEELAAPPGRVPAAGGTVCRAIADGPDEELDKLATILLGAVSAAHSRIDIVTPYFIPSRELIGALQAAALRGVEVSIVLPAKNNLPYVHWASRNMLWELLMRGVRVFYQPPPFAHTKLFVVDDMYAHVGSANMDPRSLRLNFELAVEIYDRGVVQGLARHVSGLREAAREVTLGELDGRPLPERVRDAVAWLFSPYL